jgi:hypothetical protein
VGFDLLLNSRGLNGRETASVTGWAITVAELVERIGVMRYMGLEAAIVLLVLDGLWWAWLIELWVKGHYGL